MKIFYYFILILKSSIQFYNYKIIFFFTDISFIIITDVNECVCLPCQNGGMCSDLVNGYLCNCVAGYTGTQCQTG